MDYFGFHYKPIGWQCPVCQIGLAPSCQVCPECARKRDAVYVTGTGTGTGEFSVDWNYPNTYTTIEKDEE